MKRVRLPVLSKYHLSRAFALVAGIVLFANLLSAEFTWDGQSFLNHEQTYDGFGVDTALDPHTIVSSDINIGRQAGNTGILNVVSGTLTLDNTGTWSTKVGHEGSTGFLNVSGGATVNLILNGSNEQRFLIGNHQNGTGTVNLDGGDFNVSIHPDRAITDNDAGFWIGGNSNQGTNQGTLNLSNGTFTWSGAVPARIGVGENNSGTINILHGAYIQTESDQLLFGDEANTVNFMAGGSGYISVLGWNRSQFESLVSSGNITIDGEPAEPADFAYTFEDGQGIYSLPATDDLFFIEHPSDLAVVVGGDASFSATSSGSGTQYQWQVLEAGTEEWMDMENATGPSLTLQSVTAAQNDNQYRLVAELGIDSAISDPATLTVFYPDPEIVESPLSRTAVVGGNVTLSAFAEGIGALSYVWFKDNETEPFATGSEVVWEDIRSSDGGAYTVVVTDHAAEADGMQATTASASAVIDVLDTEPAERALSWNMVGAATPGNPWGGSSQLGVLESGEAAGLLPVSNWNNSAEVNGIGTQSTPQPLVENIGFTSSATVTWTSQNTWAVTPDIDVSEKSPDGRLLHGYIERRSSQALGYTEVIFEGIHYAEYDVYVYLMGGDTGTVGRVMVNENADTALYYRTIGGIGTDRIFRSTATDAEAAGETPETNLVVFTGISGPALSVRVNDEGGNAGGIAGISIVDRTPEGIAYPPLIVSAPESELKLGGDSVAFMVEALPGNDGGELSYAWEKDGEPLAGQTGAELNLSELNVEDTGRYTVIVSESSPAGASASSRSADLIVVDVDRPALLNVDFGTAESGVMSGQGVLKADGTVQNANIGSGSTYWTGLVGVSSTYGNLLDSEGLTAGGVSVQMNGAGGVEDNITIGALGSESSGSGPLLRDYLYTDDPATPMTATVAGLEDFAGRKITLAVYAVGKYSTWFQDESDENDAATVTLAGSNNYLGLPQQMTDNSEGRDLVWNDDAYVVFEGIVSTEGTVAWSLGPDDDGGRIPMNGFQLLLTSEFSGTAPEITQQPADKVRIDGLPVQFTTAVTASPPAALQWERSFDGENWEVIEGASGSAFTIEAVSPQASANYRIVASNEIGSVASESATLEVQTFEPTPHRVISLNYLHTGGGSLNPDEFAGVVYSSNWDNRVPNGGNPAEELVDNTGDASGVSIALTSSNESTGNVSWRVAEENGDHPVQRLFRGYWDITPGGGTPAGSTGTLVAGGITYTSYDVYVYFASDATSGSPIARIDLNGGDPVFGLAAAPANRPADLDGVPDHLVEATATSSESATLSHYVRFADVTGESFTLTATKENANWGIVGIQIVNSGIEAPEAAPVLSESVVDDTVELTWSSVPEANAYHVYRGSESGVHERIATNIDVLSYTDMEAAQGVGHFYIVRGVNEGGAGAASNEVEVMIGDPGPPIGLADWRAHYFGTTENAGDAADTADPDADGVPNLLEYALGADPTVAGNAHGKISWTRNGEFLVLSFDQVGDPDLLFEIEAVDALGDQWEVIHAFDPFSEPGTETYVEEISNEESSRFLRLKVSFGEE